MVVFLVALVFVFVMADGGSDSDAPSSSESSVSSKAQQAAGRSIRHCSACGLAVKGHPGPCGKPKCVFGLVTKLEERVDELENSKNLHLTAFATRSGLAVSDRKRFCQ